MSRLFVVIVESSDAYLLNRVHDQLKAMTSDWWHQMINVWIVAGSGSGDVREKVKQADVGSATVLVLQLPSDEEDRYWSAWGRNVEERFDWLHEHLHNYKEST